jgi:hypothetical protein
MRVTMHNPFPSLSDNVLGSAVWDTMKVLTLLAAAHLLKKKYLVVAGGQRDQWHLRNECADGDREWQ